MHQTANFGAKRGRRRVAKKREKPRQNGAFCSRLQGFASICSEYQRGDSNPHVLNGHWILSLTEALHRLILGYATRHTPLENKGLSHRIRSLERVSVAVQSCVSPVSASPGSGPHVMVHFSLIDNPINILDFTCGIVTITHQSK